MQHKKNQKERGIHSRFGARHATNLFHHFVRIWWTETKENELTALLDYRIAFYLINSKDSTLR